MSGNVMGAAKTAAGKIGCTVEEYLSNRGAGRLWCHVCRSFQPRDSFAKQRKRPGGKACRCNPCSAAQKRAATAKRRATKAESWEW